MAIKGNEAKEILINAIINALSDNYLGMNDKKYYFQFDDIQVAVSLTCPKTPVDFGQKPKTKASTSTEMVNFEEEIDNSTSVEVSEEEKDFIVKLMERCGL